MCNQHRQQELLVFKAASKWLLADNKRLESANDVFSPWASPSVKIATSSITACKQEHHQIEHQASVIVYQHRRIPAEPWALTSAPQQQSPRETSCQHNALSISGTLAHNQKANSISVPSGWSGDQSGGGEAPPVGQRWSAQSYKGRLHMEAANPGEKHLGHPMGVEDG
eukprot:gene27017-2243_t